MLDIKIFGEKLKNHRKTLSLSQEAVAEKIGVSAQAVSKWENGECLPDCFNLKALADVYGISLDILMKTDDNYDIDNVSARIEQIGDEFIWAKSERNDIPNAHRDLADDLWKMWKGLYFIEVGNKELQQKEKERGSLRICSNYGMKIWDEEGVACIIKSSLKDKLGNVDDSALYVLNQLCTKEGFALITALDAHDRIAKEDLIEKCGIEISRLNELLLLFTENKIIEYTNEGAPKRTSGYKLCPHFGIAAYMVMASAFILSKKHNYSTSEYISYND